MKKSKTSKNNTDCIVKKTISNQSEDVNQTGEKIEEKQNTIILWLKRIFDLKVLSFIVAILAAIPAWNLWPKSEGEKAIDRINRNIEIIESTFKPEERENPDSLKIISQIKEFETKSLELCILWKKYNNRVPYDKYDKICGNSPEVVMNTLELNLEINNEILVKEMILMDDVLSFINESYRNDVIEENKLYVNLGALMEVSDLLNKKKNVINSTNNSSKAYIESRMKKNPSDKERVKIFLKGLSEFDKRDKSYDFLGYDDKVFELIVETYQFNNLRLKEHI